MNASEKQSTEVTQLIVKGEKGTHISSSKLALLSLLPTAFCNIMEDQGYCISLFLLYY